MIPPDRSAEFVADMEGILELYQRPPDPARPLVCFDEGGKDLQAHVREPQPMTSGIPAREDPEYERHGSANLFLSCAPHLGWRHITVRERRTGIDWALAVRELVDVHFPEAEQVVLVLDQLNTHTVASLYWAFPPAEALRIAQKLEVHYTPKHGSWLNIAELELRALGQQCLKRRIPDQTTLAGEVAAWEADRNAAGAGVTWDFTVADARRALPQVYPVPVCDTEALTLH